MSTPSSVKIAVPATTANLGPGFDCIGAALSLYNHFTLTQLEASTPALEIWVSGVEAEGVKTDESNLAYQAFLKFYEAVGKPAPAVRFDIELGIPLARGLGSSATAIVGGLVGANLLTGALLSETEVMQLAIEIEGHPDNVVPALLGGCRLAATAEDSTWEICEIPWHENVVPVVAIPDFELSTAAARSVLPATYSRADAIFNAAHLGLLLRGLEAGNGEWLRVALQDRIHQPYRQALIAGYEVVRKAAISAGAWGLVISGAGPTLLALADATAAESVQAAMAQAWQQAGISPQVHALKLDRQGVRNLS